MLKINKISKSFVGASVINNLTIDIQDSSIFGLVVLMVQVNQLYLE